MTPRSVLGWRLLSPRGVWLDPVGSALARDAAVLGCGPHAFDFTKTRAVLNDVQLRLSHRADCACERSTRFRLPRGLETSAVERLIPAVTGDLEPAIRASIEEERLSAGGRALFAHVAHLIALAESEPRGKRSLRFPLASSVAKRRIQVYPRGRSCSSPGCGTLLSTFNPSRSCSLHQRAKLEPRR
jgi:hypothetical protein